MKLRIKAVMQGTAQKQEDFLFIFESVLNQIGIEKIKNILPHENGFLIIYLDFE